MVTNMYSQLQEINRRPAPFEHYTAAELWTEEHTSSKMLNHHLNGSNDVSSRNTEFIEKSVAWIVRRFGLAENKSVVDFGCGPGLYAERLAASGADITGVDFSERSLRYARERAQSAGMAIDYVCANYFGFLNTFKYTAENVILDKYTIVEEQRVRAIYNWLQYFSVEALGAELEDRGFVVNDVVGDVAGATVDPEAHEFAIVARKSVDV